MNNCLLITGTNPGAQIQVPVGLIYLATQLSRHGYPTEIFHVTDRESVEACKAKISAQKYLFVGFSVWMGTTSLDMIELSQSAKKMGTPVVWGGKFISSLKGETLTEASVDIAVMGHAEETIVEIADCLKEKADLSKIKGIYYRTPEGDIVKTEPRYSDIANLDVYDYDLDLIQDWSKYIIKSKEGPIILDPFESQRGCKFRCSFCFHSDDELYSKGNKKIIAAHSVDFMLEKVKQLKALTNVRKISFCDDEFWIDEERSLELIRRLKEIQIGILFIRIRFTSLNDFMLKRLQELGVISIACGLESGNRRILKMMQKGLTLDVVKQKMKLLAKYPIVVNVVIIIGVPTETKEDMLESVRFMMDLRKIKRNLNVLTFFYRPLPSTDFGKIADECGFIRPKNVREWVEIAGENIVERGEWLPWYNEKEKRNMRRKEDYFFINSVICEFLYGEKRNRLIVKVLSPILYPLERLSFYRIYHWNFVFPVDARIFMYLYKLAKYLKDMR